MWAHRRSGKSHQRGHQDHREPYEHDRTRVIHSPSFRRLQRKTQILATDEGDFHRTRLTHSLEVASIGLSIVRTLSFKHAKDHFYALLPDDDLIQTICLTHDIGHPPFGHSGEIALNGMMHTYGGFEGNAQTLRLLTKLEDSYGEFGLDLTRRVLLGILKYPIRWSMVIAKDEKGLGGSMMSMNKLPPKAYFDCEQDEIDWLLSPFSKSDRSYFQSYLKPPEIQQHGTSRYYSLDCSIMDIADDIAYGVHDLEDAVHLKLLYREQLDTSKFQTLFLASALGQNYSKFLDQLFAQTVAIRKQAIGELVNYFIGSTQIEITSEEFEEPLFKYNVTLLPEARAFLDALTTCIYQHVIDSPDARAFQFGGQTIVRHLFEAFSSNPEFLLDHKNRLLFQHAQNQPEGYRIICDYIASMTDDYAYRVHEKLFGFNGR